jgi:hypothetical protein
LIVAAFFLGLSAWTVLFAVVGAWCFVWVFRMLFVKRWEAGSEEEETDRPDRRFGERVEEGP